MAECCIDFFPYCRDSKFILIGFKEAPLCVTHFPTPPSKPVSRLWLEDGFSTTFLVENPGGTPMPFCIGAHTAIRCPLMEGERFEDYQLVFDQPEDADTLLLTPEGLLRSGEMEPMLSGGKIDLDYSVFRRLDTIVFRGLQSKRVELRHGENGVALDFSQFPMVAFWTKPGVRRGAVPTVKEYGKAFDTAIPYAENRTATEDGVHRRDLGRTVREPAQKQRFVSLIFS